MITEIPELMESLMRFPDVYGNVFGGVVRWKVKTGGNSLS